jgi:transketolase
MSENKHTRVAYGDTLARLGETDKNIVVLDADLSCSTQTHRFAEKFPDRFFQMGIAEGDMMATAAGLAASGKKPFVSTFVIFASRGWEQIRNSVARTNLPVNIVLTHGGLSVGEDGASAQACEDIAIMRVLPRMKVIVPADSVETARVIEYLAAHTDGPAYVRLTRNVVPVLFDENYRFTLGKAVMLRDGGDGTIIACGQMVYRALGAAERLANDGLHIRVLNMSTIKPLDGEAVTAAARETGRIVTAEEHSVVGGLGSAVAEHLAATTPVPMGMIGVQDTFGESGTPAELFEKYGLTEEAIAEKMSELCTS